MAGSKGKEEKDKKSVDDHTGCGGGSREPGIKK